MDESSILRRRGLQVGDPSILKTQAWWQPVTEDFKVPLSFFFLGADGCTVLSIHLATGDARSLLNRQQSRLPAERCFFWGVRDNRGDFEFGTLLGGCFFPAGRVRSWLAVTGDEPVWHSVKCLGSLSRVATPCSSESTRLGSCVWAHPP